MRIAWTPHKTAFSAACLAIAALLAVPWRTHVDDLDAQLYLVVARNIARHDAWFDLSFAPAFLSRFREHLPFGFWPAAAAIKLFGERAVNPVYAALTLASVIVAGRIAKRIAGNQAEIAALLLLGTCEIIWHYGGRPLLEPPLFFFSVLAAGAALAEEWTLAACFGAAATLVKGPFGLLPLACAASAKIRNPKAALAVAGAAVPLALFLFVDPGGGWRENYLYGQLLASASGQRADGIHLWWFPFSVIARRFWPGLPFVLLGLWQCRKDPRLRPLAWTCLAMAVLLCLPPRKWGNHSYVAFPLLGALAGCAAAAFRMSPKTLAAWACGAAGAAVLFLASGLGARIMRPPCAFATSLAPGLDALPAGSPILVVSPEPDAPAMAELAAERDLAPVPAVSLTSTPSIFDAVAREGTEVPPAWKEIARGGGWLLLHAAQR
jgi:hypothetical protein